MRSYLEKMIVSQVRIELLEKFIKDLSILPDTKDGKNKRMLTNYERMLYVEKNKLAESLKCIQKEHPHECKCK